MSEIGRLPYVSISPSRVELLQICIGEPHCSAKVRGTIERQGCLISHGMEPDLSIHMQVVLLQLLLLLSLDQGSLSLQPAKLWW